MDTEARIKRLEREVSQLNQFVDAVKPDGLSRRAAIRAAGTGALGILAGSYLSQTGAAAPTSSFVEAGEYRGPAGNVVIADRVANGTQSISAGGSATVGTGLTSNSATVYVGLGMDFSTISGDSEVAAKVFGDNSAGELKVKLVEDGTSEGPTVPYDVVRVSD